MTPTRPVILWFRTDLRLADQPALQAAIQTGQPILPVYLRDPTDPWAEGGAARWWLHHSLAALGSDLAARGASLLLRQGDPRTEIPRLVAETNATAVFTGGTAEPHARAVDKALADAGVPLQRKRTTLLFSPDAIASKSGSPYSVYTPFARACLAQPAPHAPLPAPDRIQAAAAHPGDRLDDWHLLPTRPDWAGGIRATWTPGEAAAQRALRAFATTTLPGYAAARDRPDTDGTSRLSPHLHFGEISPRQVWHAIRTQPPSAAADKFLHELLWREFSQHLLWHRPELPDRPLRPEFSAMPWRDDPAALQAWQQGRTGLPIVDAGMRQLWQTGWMHNRVRMIVASVLTKYLLLDWRDGQRWFWDTLVDADLANNAANWQWVAGSGTDAAPYFRVFNPVLQGRKFDPDGAYIRHHVPELAGLSAEHIHAPWEAPAHSLAQARIVLGRSYPHPLITPAAGRQRALAAFDSIR